jgi:hypothetical protein
MGFVPFRSVMVLDRVGQDVEGVTYWVRQVCSYTLYFMWCAMMASGVTFCIGALGCARGRCVFESGEEVAAMLVGFVGMLVYVRWASGRSGSAAG